MTNRPDYWPDDATLNGFPTVRAMARGFVRSALDAGEDTDDIPDLVFRHVPGAGPEMGQSVLNEIRGVKIAPTEGFM